MQRATIAPTIVKVSLVSKGSGLLYLPVGDAAWVWRIVIRRSEGGGSETPIYRDELERSSPNAGLKLSQGVRCAIPVAEELLASEGGH